MFGLHYHWCSREVLTELERLVLEKVKNDLPTLDGRARFQAQIDVINKVQRITNDREVNLYHMVNGKPVFIKDIGFPECVGEQLLATVAMNAENDGNLKADIWLVNGYLFSILFNKSPRRAIEDHGITTDNHLIYGVRLLFDPMHPDSPHSPTIALDKLPLDFIKFIKTNNIDHIGDILVRNIKNIREIASSDVNYFILAENKRGAIAVKVDECCRELYLIRFEDGSTSSVGESFENAIYELQRI